MSAITLRRPTVRRPARLQPVFTAAQTPQVRVALPWLLLSLAATMATLIGQVPFWALSLFAVCTVWRHVIDRRGWALPSMTWRLIVFLPAATGVFLTYGVSPGAPGMLTLLTALLALKILEMRAARDMTFVALLGYFMILSAFFYNQSLGLSIYLGFAVLLNTVALIRCHGGGSARPMGATVKLALGMIAQALPLVVFLFVIFPRFQGQFLQRLSGATTGLTGMSEHLEPGSFSALVQSDQKAFVAKIKTPNGRAVSYLYWRGLVLDICQEGLHWEASSGRAELKPDSAAALPDPRRIEQQITLSDKGQWLFALDRPTEVVRSSSLPSKLLVGNVIRADKPVASKGTYTVYSQPYGSPGSPAPIFSGSVPKAFPYPLDAFVFRQRENIDRRRQDFYERYTRLPSDLSPKTMSLAQDWRKQAHSSEDIVRAARRYFHDGGFTYTLNPGTLPLRGGLDKFLFQTRKGFCEHYAAAFSALMRAAGVPSRIVVGYLGGEFNGWGSGYYIVRQSDAHAWAEVWIEGKGWQREDPTAVVAPERLSFGGGDFAELGAEGGSEASRMEQLRQLNNQRGWKWLAHNAVLAWDSVDQQWNLFVLSYDQDQQSTFMDQLGLGRLDWVGGTTLALSGIFGLLALGTLGMRVFRFRPAALDPAQRLYRRFCERVRDAAALQRAESEGPLDFAARARAALPDCAAQISAVTESYIASRYAPAGASSESTLTRLRQAVKEFRPRKAQAQTSV